MLKHHLRIALRTLRMQAGHTTINVAGLALGMACCLLLLQYVAYETRFDAFHEKADRIYRVAFESTQNGEEQGSSAWLGYFLGPAAEREVPEIVRSARVHSGGEPILSYQTSGGEDRTFKERHVLYVDSTFLSMFDFPLVKGDGTRALRQPQTMLLSERVAQKYFGAEDPVGKTVAFTGVMGSTSTYTVAGVFEEVPPTSHLRFDLLLPMEDLLAIDQYQQPGTEVWQNFVTYFEIEAKTDLALTEAKLTELYTEYQAEDFAASHTEAAALLQPLTAVHLDPEVQGLEAAEGDRETVYFFTVIGLITLIIAFFNYVNLATASALKRAKEVGVRKVVGARKEQLLGRFLMESALTHALALVLAIGLALTLAPVVNRVAEVQLTWELWLDSRFWAAVVGLCGLGALLAGLYPAFVLTSFEPAAVLKGKAGAFAGGRRLREVLVVTQFAASIALMAGTAIVYTQLSYMRGLDTGLDLEQVLVVDAPVVRAGDGNRGAEMTALKDELRKLPAVWEVGLSRSTPGRFANIAFPLYLATEDPSEGKPALVAFIDHDFPAVYGLELVAGRPFYEGMAVPDREPQPVIVNETMVQKMGFASNGEALGAQITGGPGFDYVIRGVYEDFRWSSAHQETEAMAFAYDGTTGSISMKVHTAALPNTIAAVGQVYGTLFPGNPFNYTFADDSFDAQYQADRRFAALFSGFAGLAILIACLGLFGLASFTAQQRTKEIGVRKVLGASVVSLVVLLSRDFLKLVGIAFLIAAPVAYIHMDGWLTDFAYHIDLGPTVFLLAGALAIAIALLTVSYQTVKAARIDPVRTLRYE